MAHKASHLDRPDLLTPDEVARILRVTPRTVRRWGADGRLQRIRLGGRLTRYAADSVAALIAPTTTNAAVGSGGVATEGDDPHASA